MSEPVVPGRSVCTWLLLVLVVLVGAAYIPAFSGAWIFDDSYYILNNESLRQLWPPCYMSGNSRPLLFLTFAVDYALYGYNVWGYHTTNLLIHMGCCLLLFGLVYRLMCQSRVPPCLQKRALPIAWVSAGLWGVHPVNTMAVTYTWQRCESLMTFFFLLTLYTFVRGRLEERRGWLLFSWFACLAGMAVKEHMAIAPVALVLVDGIFFAPSWRTLLEQRRKTHLLFATTWGLLACLVGFTSEGFHGHPGLGFGSIWYTPLTYAYTTPGVHLHYLRLAFYPVPLVFDYYWPPVLELAQGLPALLAMVSVACCIAVGVCKRRRWSLPLAIYSLALLPTTSFMPMPDPAFEYRLYLPLAMMLPLLVCLVVWGLHFGLQPLAGAQRLFYLSRLGGMGAVALLIAFGSLTFYRNSQYRSPVFIWSETVLEQPRNRRAWSNLGRCLLKAGRLEEAEGVLRQGLTIRPRYPLAAFNLGMVLYKQKRLAEAEHAFMEAVRGLPDYGPAQYRLGSLRVLTGRFELAETNLRRAVALNPRHVESHHNLGVALLRQGRAAEAVGSFECAHRLDPSAPFVYEDWGAALLMQGDLPGAVTVLGEAVRLGGCSARTLNHYAVALIQSDRSEAALPVLRQACEKDPAHAGFRYNLAEALRRTGHGDEARAALEKTLELEPGHAAARQALKELAP